jgi:hypothetical protein
MIDRNALVAATIAGTVLQLAMIVTGHFSAWVAEHVFMFGGLGISAVAGGYYAQQARGGFAGSALGGAVAGGVCALIGIAASVVLGDVPVAVLAFGTIGSTVAGAMGGVIGQTVFGSRAALS